MAGYIGLLNVTTLAVHSSICHALANKAYDMLNWPLFIGPPINPTPNSKMSRLPAFKTTCRVAMGSSMDEWVKDINTFLVIRFLVVRVWSLFNDQVSSLYHQKEGNSSYSGSSTIAMFPLSTPTYFNVTPGLEAPVRRRQFAARGLCYI